MNPSAILRAVNLSKHYVHKPSLFSPKMEIVAVDMVSLEILEGETFGLIGESGCGKSTLARLLLRLVESNSGVITFLGEPISDYTGERMKPVRRNLQIIFQAGSSVLDPKRTVGELLREPLVLHSIVDRKDIANEVLRLLEMVGLPASDQYKHISEMSGGQVQRVLIARTISVRPRMIVCDEPVSALDVSVQGQILNLLISLKKELGVTYLFISHDLKVIRHICDRVAVMAEGRIVEEGLTSEVLSNPRHHLTRTLLTSELAV